MEQWQTHEEQARSMDRGDATCQLAVMGAELDKNEILEARVDHMEAILKDLQKLTLKETEKGASSRQLEMQNENQTPQIFNDYEYFIDF